MVCGFGDSQLLRCPERLRCPLLEKGILGLKGILAVEDRWSLVPVAMLRSHSKSCTLAA